MKLYGRTKAEQFAQARDHLHFVRVGILRAPWAHLEQARDHPGDCRGDVCKHEQKLRAEADELLEAMTELRRAIDAGDR